MLTQDSAALLIQLSAQLGTYMAAASAPPLASQPGNPRPPSTTSAPGPATASAPAASRPAAGAAAAAGRPSAPPHGGADAQALGQGLEEAPYESVEARTEQLMRELLAHDRFFAADGGAAEGGAGREAAGQGAAATRPAGRCASLLSAWCARRGLRFACLSVCSIATQAKRAVLASRGHVFARSAGGDAASSSSVAVAAHASSAAPHGPLSPTAARARRAAGSSGANGASPGSTPAMHSTPSMVIIDDFFRVEDEDPLALGSSSGEDGDGDGARVADPGSAHAGASSGHGGTWGAGGGGGGGGARVGPGLGEWEALPSGQALTQGLLPMGGGMRGLMHNSPPEASGVWYAASPPSQSLSPNGGGAMQAAVARAARPGRAAGGAGNPSGGARTLAAGSATPPSGHSPPGGSTPKSSESFASAGSASSGAVPAPASLAPVQAPAPSAPWRRPPPAPQPQPQQPPELDALLCEDYIPAGSPPSGVLGGAAAAAGGFGGGGTGSNGVGGGAAGPRQHPHAPPRPQPAVRITFNNFAGMSVLHTTKASGGAQVRGAAAFSLGL